jgi:hypothetical protein
MDELFWGRDHEDVSDWAERLSMAAEVRDLNANKLFKICQAQFARQGPRVVQKITAGTSRHQPTRLS